MRLRQVLLDGGWTVLLGSLPDSRLARSRCGKSVTTRVVTNGRGELVSSLPGGGHAQEN